MAEGSPQYKVGPLPMIRSLIQEGVPATEGLRRFRELGGSIRTQRWYSAYGELSAEAAVRPMVMEASSTTPFRREQITPVASNKPGGYLYRGGVIVTRRMVNPITGQTVETTETNWASVRSNRILSPADVEAELESKFGTEGQSGVERSTVVGSFVAAVNQLVPVEDAA